MSTPTTLTLEEVRNVYSGLAGLDGYSKVTDNASGIVPYKFDDKTRYAIGKNKGILKREVDYIQDQRTKIMDELSDPKGSGSIVGTNLVAQEQYRQRDRALLKETTEVLGLIKLKQGALLADNANPIPGSVIEALLPLIEETA